MSEIESHYHLMENDHHEIKYFAKDRKPSLLALKALTILSYMYGGLHNMPWTQKEKFDYENDHCVSTVWFGSMATWDANKLTTLVVLAHEMAMRVEVSPRAFNYLKISFWQRQRTGATYERHPTIDDVIKSWRE